MSVGPGAPAIQPALVHALRGLARLPRPAPAWSARWTAVAVVGAALVGVAAVRGPLDALGSTAGAAGGIVLTACLGKRVGRLWTWLAVVTALGLGLGLLPLFGVLGYELAIAMAPVAAILGLDLGAALARALARLPATGITRATYAGRTLLHTSAFAAGLAGALVLVPAAMAAVRGLWLPTCDWGYAIKAYLLLPVTTAALGGALGHVLGVLVGPRRVLGAVVAQLPAIAVAVCALLRFYGAPPVFTYNAILGYFPGNLYDENVELGAALLWSRLEQALGVLGLGAVVALVLDVPRLRAAWAPRPAGRRWGCALVATLALGGTGALYARSGQLGYRIDVEDIEVALGGRLETPHFVIHYAATPAVMDVIWAVIADHELRYAQVVAQLGVAPAGKLRSFYFADRAQKARWMGARDVEMAKPWRREIYLEHRGFPHGSLRHEIAHAVASAFGDPWFGVAARRVLGVPALISPGLIEGLAVAVDWPGGYERLTPHEAVRALQLMGKQPPLRALLGLQFFSVSSATGYTTAGSFLRFLLDTHGAAALRSLYHSGGDFERAYGRPLAALEADWRAMLAAIPVPPAVVEASRERFRVASVFQRPCPHAIAARRERSLEALGRGDRAEAVALMRQVCGDAPEEPRHLLGLGDLLAAGDAGERAEALVLWTAIALDVARVTTSVRAEAYERLARAAAARDDLAEVRRLIGIAVTLPLDPAERRQLDAFAFALAHTGPAGPALRGYFFGGVPGLEPATWAQLATLAEPTSGFAHYLLGLQRLQQGAVGDAAIALERGLVLGLPGRPFVKNAARRLAAAAYRAGDRPGVALAITVLGGADMATGDRLLARDWLERLVFDATGALPAPLTSRP